MARQRNSAKECRWLELIRLWQQSGLSVRAFCQRHQLGEPRFYVWRRVLRQRGLMDRKSVAAARRGATTPTFVKVAVDTQNKATTPIDLVLAQGRRLRVRAGFDPELLRQLLRLLEEVSAKVPSC